MEVRKGQRTAVIFRHLRDAGVLRDEYVPLVYIKVIRYGESIKAAVNWIKSIASDPEIGHIYEGTVVKTMDFGAFVNFFGAKDGLVHISQLAPNRVQKTTDVVKEGDKVFVKLMGFDERGKVRLSMKVVDQTTGKEIVREKRKEDAEDTAA